MACIYPIVLCGGSGSRLWPLSRQSCAKQFLPIASNKKTLVQQTIERLDNRSLFYHPVFVNNDNNRFLLLSQLEQIQAHALVHILEPEQRNTAPACAVGVSFVHSLDPDGLVLILPSDQAINDNIGFQEYIHYAIPLANANNIVIFGIKPTEPSTGFGYVHTATPTASHSKAPHVRSFKEKPTLDMAKQYIQEGNYYWNAGIILAKASLLIQLFQEYQPSLLKNAQTSLQKAIQDKDFLRLDKENFSLCPSEPVDTAIMEKVPDKTVIVPFDNIVWRDLGTWTSVYEYMPKDDNNNVLIGNIIHKKTSNTYINESEKNKTVVAIGVDDLTIIDTKDALLVTNSNHDQDIKDIVNEFIKKENKIALTHKKVDRPWGFYETLEETEFYQIKQLTVFPGQSLSLQMHCKRNEHWLVVKGKPQWKWGSKKILLPNQSIDIPYYTKHRLSNVTQEPICLIEIQTGSYFGEDDIIRFDDIYGRLENEMNNRDNVVES